MFMLSTAKWSLLPDLLLVVVIKISFFGGPALVAWEYVPGLHMHPGRFYVLNSCDCMLRAIGSACHCTRSDVYVFNKPRCGLCHQATKERD